MNIDEHRVVDHGWRMCLSSWAINGLALDKGNLPGVRPILACSKSGFFMTKRVEVQQMPATGNPRPDLVILIWD